MEFDRFETLTTRRAPGAGFLAGSISRTHLPGAPELGGHRDDDDGPGGTDPTECGTQNPDTSSGC